MLCFVGHFSGLATLSLLDFLSESTFLAWGYMALARGMTKVDFMITVEATILKHQYECAGNIQNRGYPEDRRTGIIFLCHSFDMSRSPHKHDKLPSIKTTWAVSVATVVAPRHDTGCSGPGALVVNSPAGIGTIGNKGQP